MPDHPPTQPAPMSESQLNAMSHPDDKPTFAELYQQRKALVAEIRRLNAAAKAAWKAAGDEMVWRMAVENDRDAKAKELTAVRAAVEEESKRADKAKAAARELRTEVACLWHGEYPEGRTAKLLDSTAWLSTGGNDGKS